MKKLTVKYEPEQDHVLFKDSACMPYALELVQEVTSPDGVNTVLLTSQELMVECIRVLVARKLIGCDDVEFEFLGQKISVDAHGRLSDWPSGFCDYRDNLVLELLGDSW